MQMFDECILDLVIAQQLKSAKTREGEESHITGSLVASQPFAILLGFGHASAPRVPLPRAAVL
jgi:hypothetical protein